jgi:hypothetical protein
MNISDTNTARDPLEFQLYHLPRAPLLISFERHP